MVFVLKLLCLVAQLVLTGMIVHQLWHPYRTGLWVRAWRAFLLASIVLVGRRVYAFWVAMPVAELIVTLMITGWLLYGLWALACLFETDLEIPPPPPRPEENEPLS